MCSFGRTRNASVNTRTVEGVGAVSGVAGWCSTPPWRLAVTDKANPVADTIEVNIGYLLRVWVLRLLLNRDHCAFGMVGSALVSPAWLSLDSQARLE